MVVVITLPSVSYTHLDVYKRQLHTNGYDEALSLPTEAAAKIALRTQQVIAFESGVTDTVDPLAGSYFVETLTDEIETAVQAYIDKIDAMGGSVNAIENGYIQQEIANSAYQYQKEVESAERVIVGVNKFTQETEGITDTLTIDESIRYIQTEKLNNLKANRDNAAVKIALENLGAAAKTDANLMPFILTAVEEYATLGEIADCMRNVFGEY